MDIYDISIKNIRMGSLYSDEIDGLRHIKQLPYLSVVRVVEGNLMFGLGKEEVSPTGESGLFIAPSNIIQTIIHKVNPRTGYIRADWIFLEATVNGLFFLDEIFRFPSIIAPQSSGKWNKVFDGMAGTDNICDKKIFGYELIKLLINCGELTNFSSNEEISRICRYIHDNYSKDIKVCELAELACMSESNFYAVFKKHTGVSPVVYMNNCRIAAATQLLLYSHKKINEIAVEVGIFDPYYFSRIFRQKYGVSPREYRRQNCMV